MNLTELQLILDDLTWEVGVENDEHYLADLMKMCDNQNQALILILKWYNANRPDEGTLKAI